MATAPRFKVFGPYGRDEFKSGKRYCLCERDGSDWRSRGLFHTLAEAKAKQREIVRAEQATETFCTRDELIEKVRPFVNAKLHKQPIAETTRIDIRTWGTCKVDASVRAVGPEGIEVFFYSGCDLIPWDNVREIIIGGKDRSDGAAYVPEWCERRAAA